MVFLRELAQNARDAGARQIVISTAISHDTFKLVFRDNGSGMRFDEARAFLFTLYSSSKERETKSAGRFGVGFWSVLLFDPRSIEIESRTHGHSGWHVSLTGDLTNPVITEKPETQVGIGTRIVLKKNIQSTAEGQRLRKKVQRALSRYCRYLRRNDATASPLPLVFDGNVVNRPYALNGSCWMTFRNGAVEGAVGLGDRPSVSLYARGLLVWRGSVLEELRYKASPSETVKFPDGLAPVFLLGGNHLSVTLDRRAVVDDKELARVRRVARQRMRELVFRYLDGIAPRPLWQRAIDRVTTLFQDVLRSDHHRYLLIGVALMVLVAIGMAVIPRVLRNVPTPDLNIPGVTSQVTSQNAVAPPPEVSHQAPSQEADIPLGNALPFSGPIIDPQFQPNRVRLTYAPPMPMLFRIAAYEQLHPGLGIVGAAPTVVPAAQSSHCRETCVDIQVAIDVKPGPFVMPVPTCGRLASGPVRLNNQPIKRTWRTHADEPALVFKQKMSGSLTYRADPTAGVLSPQHRDRLLFVPRAMTLPDELRSVVSTAKRQPTRASQVAFLQAYVQQRIVYDNSQAALATYRAFVSTQPMTGWLDFVLANGLGDCDVKNTVLIVALRRIGIPARLAVGLIGADGQTFPGMHAWVEYYNRGWKHVDATGSAQGRQAPSGVNIDHPQLPVLPEDSPSSRSSWAEWTTTYAGVLGIAAAALAVLAGVFLLSLMWTGQKRRETIHIAENDDDHRRRAAEMALNTLAFPETGQVFNGVQQVRIFPVAGSKTAMTLKEALRRSKQRRLWYTEDAAGWIDLVGKNSARVLDGSDPTLEPLIKRLPGIANVDDLTCLRPVAPQDLDKPLAPVGQLISTMNATLRRAGLNGSDILPCTGLAGSSVRDVDLSGLGLPQASRGPIRFVAVMPTWEMLQKNATLNNKYPGLAVFSALASIVPKSAYLTAHRREILALAAKQAIEAFQ
ncbi:MAG: transglutaminase domain-containing protein [Myxococcota bacterium]|nr:transglutaminase domain-containing protein [Myxococcota bacterium]